LSNTTWPTLRSYTGLLFNRTLVRVPLVNLYTHDDKNNNDTNNNNNDDNNKTDDDDDVSFPRNVCSLPISIPYMLLYTPHVAYQAPRAENPWQH